MKTSDAIQLITTLFAALMAGLFYSYSFSVNPGLGKLDSAQYLRAMQSINREIQNPVFFTCFMGLLILLPLCAYLNFSPWSLRAKLFVAATLVYAVGVFGITVFGNVPLNEALDHFEVTGASQKMIELQRERFQAPWNSLNTARTFFSIITLVLLLLAQMDKSAASAGNIS